MRRKRWVERERKGEREKQSKQESERQRKQGHGRVSYFICTLCMETPFMHAQSERRSTRLMGHMIESRLCTYVPSTIGAISDTWYVCDIEIEKERVCACVSFMFSVCVRVCTS